MNARTRTAGVFGTLAGLGSLTHGIGEILQGDVPRASFWLPSWMVGPIAEHLDGDPAVGVLPTMLSCGVATTIASLALIAASVATARGWRGGGAIASLGAVNLLAGGGGAPPVLAALSGLVATSAWERAVRRLPRGARRALAQSWAPLFWVAVANGVFLVVGSVVLTAAFAFHHPDVFVSSFFAAIALLVVLGLAGTARDLGE